MNMAPGRRWPPRRCVYVGDAVAIVVAETKAQARDAAEAVAIDFFFYEELPAVTAAVTGAGSRRAAASSRGQGAISSMIGRSARPRPSTRRSPRPHM